MGLVISCLFSLQFILYSKLGNISLLKVREKILRTCETFILSRLLLLLFSFCLFFGFWEFFASFSESSWSSEKAGRMPLFNKCKWNYLHNHRSIRFTLILGKLLEYWYKTQ